MPRFSLASLLQPAVLFAKDIGDSAQRGSGKYDRCESQRAVFSRQTLMCSGYLLSCLPFTLLNVAESMWFRSEETALVMSCWGLLVLVKPLLCETA